MTPDDRFRIWFFAVFVMGVVGFFWAAAWMQSKKYEAEARACECAERRR